MTIGAKLGIGFGVVIALLAISAGTAYYNVTRIEQNMNVVLDQAVPTVRSCDRLLSSLNQASAGLRGYLANTTDAKQAAVFRAENASAWKDVDEELSRLTTFASALDDTAMRDHLTTLNHLIDEQRKYHEHILQVAGTEENFPATQMFTRDAAPALSESLSVLDQIIDEEATLEATVERKQLLKAMVDVRTSYGTAIADMTGYLSLGDEDALRALEESWQASGAAVEFAQQLSGQLEPSQRKHWDRLIALRNNLNPLRSQLIKRRSADDWNTAEYVWLTQSAPRGREVRAILDQIAGEAESRRLAEKAQVHAASQTTITSLLAATLLSIVIGCTVATLLSRRIVAIVRSLADRANEISGGDLRGEAVVTRGADELVPLCDGFNTMLTNLRWLTGQILSVTENVNSATSQISSSAKQQATSTKEQAATVQEVTSTMQEISQAGAQIVAKAKEVAAVAEQASSTSKSGMDAVQNTNRTMEAIREQVEEVAENIVALSEKTQAVGEIIATVNEIAEQSNLLALNATIEAAEAGDEGKRFSVVAGEMKNLADQAKECTIHVRKILGEIQKAINTSVMLTEEAVKRVESGKQQADVSENVIRQISSTTEESIQAFQQIIAATNQQQIGLEQVAHGMQNIDQAAQQTATGTGQLEQAAVSLSAMSTQLRTAVAGYKV